MIYNISIKFYTRKGTKIMNKRFLSLAVTAIMMLSSATCFAQSFVKLDEMPYTQPEYLDPMNNELFEITGEISEEEFMAMYNVSTEELQAQGNDAEFRDTEKYPYNDGLAKKWFTTQETIMYGNEENVYEYKTSALTDINDNKIFSNETAEQSAMSYSYYYNLGYICEKGAVNYNDETSTMEFETVFINAVTGEKYYFYPIGCSGFLNDGTTYINIGEKYYKAKLKKPAVVTTYLDGKKLYFDQLPVIENNRTLVPLRAIFEALGASVEWNGDTKTITAVKDDTTVILTVDSTEASKNDEGVTLDVPAKVVSGRTLVPVRFIADCFGVGVEWNGDMLQVLLTSQN